MKSIVNKPWGSFEIIDEGEETLYLAIYNSSNQRSYITVKLK